MSGLLLATKPLGSAERGNGESLAKWIQNYIPCFRDEVPVSYTEDLRDILLSNGVAAKTIGEAFDLLEDQGLRFEFPINWPLPWHMARKPRQQISNSAPQMKPISAGEARKSLAHTFEEYEWKYNLAIRTNNAPGAEQIIAAVLQLLWGLAKGYGTTKQAAQNVKMVEWEEFNQAVDESLARARTLQTHIRYLSKEQLRELREAATPGTVRNISFRIARTVTTRTVPPSRRARR